MTARWGGFLVGGIVIVVGAYFLHNAMHGRPPLEGPPSE